jgi:hypothetical protein
MGLILIFVPDHKKSWCLELEPAGINTCVIRAPPVYGDGVGGVYEWRGVGLFGVVRCQ